LGHGRSLSSIYRINRLPIRKGIKMTQEVTIIAYLLIGAFFTIALLAYWCLKLWRYIDFVDASAAYASDTSDRFRDIRRELARAEKRVKVLEDGIVDLSGHADLTTQWIKAATDKLVD
jgi:hypothetical protein